MDAIVVVLSTGCQWHALHQTHIGSRRSAYCHVQAWVEAEVGVVVWEQGLAA
jgi:hypothetical protein